MDLEQAAALRKPFPKESIGKLPKGGTMLDYVGHAATTDRLLAVDPLWSWEPFATDANGLPALDSKNNLWIRLTICGVTRIGVGDGTSAKIIVGDAIRNAAMRFGVALDLWSKEELEGSSAEGKPAAQPSAPAVTRTMSRAPRTTPATETDINAPVASVLTDPQLKAIHTGMGKAGLGERVAGLAFLSEVVGHEVTTSKTLTKTEAGKVLNQLAEINQGIVADVEPVWT